MRRRSLPLILLALCGTFVAPPSGAEAASVFRCEVLGRTLYQQHPCDEGREVVVRDERTQAQRREAMDVAHRQAASARSLAQDRAEELRRSPPRTATILGRRQQLAPEPASKPPRQRQIIRSKRQAANRAADETRQPVASAVKGAEQKPRSHPATSSR